MASHAREWLHLAWHADRLDAVEADAAVAAVLAEPIAVEVAGWRSDTRRHSRLAPDSPTLGVLHQLAGDAMHGRRRDQPRDEALAAAARAVIRRRA